MSDLEGVMNLAAHAETLLNNQMRDDPFKGKNRPIRHTARTNGKELTSQMSKGKL